MKHTQNDARLETGHAQFSRRRAPQRRQDRQKPETASAIREFEIWDRAMTRQYGRLYYLRLGLTLH